MFKPFRNLWRVLSLLPLLTPGVLRAEDPELILSLEDHKNWYCKVDEEIHVEAAKSGHLVMAKEGLAYGQVKDGQHGYEDPLSHGLALIIKAHWLFERIEQRSLRERKLVSNFRHFRQFFWNVRGNEALRQGWARLRQDGFITGAGCDVERRIVTTLDRCLDPGNDRYEETMEELAALDSLLKEPALARVFREFGKSLYRDLANRPWPGRENPIPSGLLDAEVIFRTSDDYQAGLLADRILLDLRNEDMAANLARIYPLARARRVPLVVVIGSNHAEGIVPILRRRLPGVPIRTRHSWQAFNHLWESPTPARAVANLDTFYRACQPERQGYGNFLRMAEMKGRLLLWKAEQEIRELEDCPRSLTQEEILEEVGNGGLCLPGSDLPEHKLSAFADCLEGHGMAPVVPCVIL